MNEEELRKMNLERLRNSGSVLYTIIFERYKILPLISTLSAALVGLVIQGTDLVKIKVLAFISFITLLILIPLSIFGILYQLGCDAKNLGEKIENILEPRKSLARTSNFMSTFPWVVYGIFLVAIIFIILSFFNFQ